tara:strand:+ start:585 stop:2855 length:2271 start_codon:yes stop_codon:yes gene_type:complete
MIITENKSKRVVQSHDFNSVNCTIDAEDMRYVASLLRNNYSNTRLAVVREISANALDANLEAKSDRKIEVKLPTSMNPTFAVRDFGGGLSEEDVFGLYSKYGKSTKRDSNNYIGAFGIGKFAPLSYGDNFTCVSYHGGVKASYNVFVNEDDDTKIVQLHKEPSNEPSGLSIEVAVSEDDINEFKSVVQNFFKFFSDEEMPKFLGVEDNFIEKEEKILESKNDEWFILQSEQNYYSRHEAHVIMGRVAYPLDRHAINVDNFLEDNQRNNQTSNIVNNMLSMDGFYLRVPLGSVKLHHSRESLEYNKATQQKIVESLLRAVEEIQEIAKEKLADSEDLWEAKRNYARILNAMPYNMRSIFENSFEWQGMKIKSPDFHRDYQLADDLIITHSWKEDDPDARNGFKIRSQKENRVICQDNYLVMFQDLESSHGNNLRVRTLMNEDEDLQGVYIVHCKSNSAQNSVDHEWEFGKVDKKHVKYTSNVEKEKPNRSGIRKANGSRANIPLFMFNTDRGVYKNADHWKDASADLKSIDDDASSIDGNWDGQLIYVPIKNYKIDDEDMDLDAMKSRLSHINAIREEKDLDKLHIFGVRKGDVSKLGSAWINFKDFYLYFAKEIVTDNLKESKEIFNSIKIKKDDSENKLREFNNDLAQVFCLDIKFPKSHKITEAKNLWNSIDNTNSYACSRYVHYLYNFDFEWLNKTLSVKSSLKEILSKLNDIKTSYPMLIHFAVHYSSWRGMEKDVEKDVLNYISLCDGVGA